ncbi:uncharacterized protein LOC126839759 [Adelges cooleyi]|uniref:uncharacterized protein LOC126839759 n=1 Tax=Adelges cooleyi TaxID=133065 RepID=UPI00217FE626|nr:uncharacterized protein LOC126839759 [Adelges cooleyi]
MDLDSDASMVTRKPKHRRSYSVGCPVKIDQIFWQQEYSKAGLENISSSIVQATNSSPFKSSRPNTSGKSHCARRKSMNAEERDQNLMRPLMQTFQQCCNQDEEKNLKLKLNALKVLRENDEQRLNALVLENKNLQNTFETVCSDLRNVKKELDELCTSNKHLEYRIQFVTNETSAVQDLDTQNTIKILRVDAINELNKKIDFFEKYNSSLRENISTHQYKFTMGQKQYEKFKCKMQEEKITIDTLSMCMRTRDSTGKMYKDYLLNEQSIVKIDIQDEFNKHYQLKSKLTTALARTGLMLTITKCIDKRSKCVLPNFFLYLFFNCARVIVL